MTDCMDAMSAPEQLRAGPLEGFTTWLFAGVVRVARLGDHLAGAGLTSVLAWRQRARQRTMLRSLNPRMLRDVGLSVADVERECTKPFWMQ